MRLLAGLTAVMFVAITAWASADNPPVRASTKQVTSSTTPTRDRTRPYTFTTTGRVVPPPFCAQGDPGKFAGSCVPLLCPSPITAYSYCVPPTPANLCSGKVTVRVKHLPGPYTLSSRTVSLRSNCTYRSQVSFRTRNPLRRGTLRIYARFEGNAFLLPRNAVTHIVRAG